MTVQTVNKVTGILTSSDTVQNIAHGTGISHTGDTSDTTLATVTIPAYTLSVGDSLRFEAVLENDNGAGAAPAGTMTVRVKVDGTSIVSIATVARSLTISKPMTVESSVLLVGTGNSYYRDEKGTTWQEVAIDITADITVIFSIQHTNAADYAYLRSYNILLIKD